MRPCIPGLSAEGYRPSVLHAADRDWPETNCYTDVWIEILHARGVDPRAALSFTVAQDFEGDHFTFFKFPPEDLEELFGARISELAIYDSVEAQVGEQLARGRMTLVEVDSFYLPDTKGAGYRQEHGKTTIGVNLLAADEQRMEYFHGPGFYALSGEDYAGAFGQLPLQIAGHMPFPYVEFVKFGDANANVSLAGVLALLRRHLARRPRANPVARFQACLEQQAAMVVLRPPGFFHKYAFNTFRQIGANFELLAAHLDWLTEQAAPGLGVARAAAALISGEAKVMQFQLARAVARNRTEGLALRLDPMAEAYDTAMSELVRLYPDPV